MTFATAPVSRRKLAALVLLAMVTILALVGCSNLGEFDEGDVARQAERYYAEKYGEDSRVVDVWEDRSYALFGCPACRPRSRCPGAPSTTDVTELGLSDDARKVHLSPCVDPYDGDVVALSAGAGPSRALVAEMPEGAVAATGGLTPRSDRGWRHRTPDRVAACEAAGAARSMSRRRHSPDNAAAEGLFGRLRVELLHGRDWSGVTAGEFVGELSGCIRWYGEGRLKAFGEGGGTAYDTIRGRRERLGLAA